MFLIIVTFFLRVSGYSQKLKKIEHAQKIVVNTRLERNVPMVFVGSCVRWLNLTSTRSLIASEAKLAGEFNGISMVYVSYVRS